jgi:hypothetical protein
VTATFEVLQTLHPSCNFTAPESLACYAAMRRFCYELPGCANRTPVAWGPTAADLASLTFNCVEGFIVPVEPVDARPFVDCQAQYRSAACAVLAHQVCQQHGGATGQDVQEFGFDVDGGARASVGCVNPPVTPKGLSAAGSPCTNVTQYGTACFSLMQATCTQAGFAGTAGPLDQPGTVNTPVQIACFN